MNETKVQGIRFNTIRNIYHTICYVHRSISVGFVGVVLVVNIHTFIYTYFIFMRGIPTFEQRYLPQLITRLMLYVTYGPI